VNKVLKKGILENPAIWSPDSSVKSGLLKKEEYWRKRSMKKNHNRKGWKRSFWM